jgi:hypothetical protein
MCPGNYSVTWSVTDSLGITVTATRVVMVRPTMPLYTFVAKTGDAVPGSEVDSRIQAGAIWTAVGSPAISDTGDVAYLAKWKAPVVKGADPHPAQSGTGVFINDTLLVKVGDPVPGAGTDGLPTDAILNGFRDPVMNQAGRVAFLASIKGASVSEHSDNVVISNGWTGILEVVAREGNEAPGTNGAVLRVSGMFRSTEPAWEERSSRRRFGGHGEATP